MPAGNQPSEMGPRLTAIPYITFRVHFQIQAVPSTRVLCECIVRALARVYLKSTDLQSNLTILLQPRLEIHRYI